MESIEIHCTARPDWHHDGNAWVTGAATVNGSCVRGSNLAQRLERVDDLDAFVAAVTELNGFFAVIRRGQNAVFAAVDRLRSIPLFYGERNGHFCISDSAAWVQRQVGDQERDPVAEAEFRLTGYVTGADTLSPRVKQLQAGEALVTRAGEHGLTVETVRYYRYLYRGDLPSEERALREQFDNVLLSCCERLVDWAAGRPLAIPLSGGFDSRLIAVMLKRLGYKRLLAFSYGRPGNRQSEVSRRVAHSLDIPWHFVPYSNEAWRGWFQSTDRRMYFDAAHQLVSVPHIQDWPAIGELGRQGVLPKDTAFVPGHSGDFLAGSHIPKSFVGVDKVDRDRFFDALFSQHYSLWDWKAEKALLPLFQERVLTAAGGEPDGSLRHAVELFETWDWQERQAKFIVNSVRAYEVWGYSWWLPLWDTAMLDFWSRVPLSWRLRQQLYIDAVQDLCARTLHSSELEIPPTASQHRLIRLAKATGLTGPAIRLYKRLQEYDHHPLAWYGIIDRGQFRSSFSGREGINSFLATYILNGDRSARVRSRGMLADVWLSAAR